MRLGLERGVLAWLELSITAEAERDGEVKIH